VGTSPKPVSRFGFAEQNSLLRSVVDLQHRELDLAVDLHLVHVHVEQHVRVEH
jgi:hypothetical protein